MLQFQKMFEGLFPKNETFKKNELVTSWMVTHKFWSFNLSHTSKVRSLGKVKKSALQTLWISSDNDSQYPLVFKNICCILCLYIYILIFCTEMARLIKERSVSWVEGSPNQGKRRVDNNYKLNNVNMTLVIMFQWLKKNCA